MAPPPPRAEVIVERERPSPRHVWISGYWVWRGGAHAWVGGHWELPPRERVVWVEPRWEVRGGSYVFVAGTWRDASAFRETVVVKEAPAQAVREIVVHVAPPPMRKEVIIERPSAHHVWIAGYWGWRSGRHEWIAGRWEQPPRGKSMWVEARWERRGDGFVFVEGFWR